MGTFKDEANSYEPTGYKNVSELEKIDVNTVIFEETKTDKEGKPYTVKYIEEEGNKYRIPISVIAQLQTILEEKPTLKHFKVKRKGTTKEDTKYTVIQLD